VGGTSVAVGGGAVFVGFGGGISDLPQAVRVANMRSNPRIAKSLMVVRLIMRFLLKKNNLVLSVNE
jgi:hypothetical protein